MNFGEQGWCASMGLGITLWPGSENQKPAASSSYVPRRVPDPGIAKLAGRLPAGVYQGTYSTRRHRHPQAHENVKSDYATAARAGAGQLYC